MKYSLKTVAAVIFFLIFAGCNLNKESIITGKTMGTAYHIKVVSLFYKDTEGLKGKIENRLKDINKSMSTFSKESEITRFNTFDSEEKFAISADFLQVMNIARKIYDLSGGAWDGTVYPLVELWGFGPKERKGDVPDKKDIQKTLINVGFDKIEISESGYLVKRNPSVSLDLASIAKGYGVDEIADVIRKEGINNFLVEIGGEVYASGLRKDGGYWRVGINRPDKNALLDEVYKTVMLKNKGLATSGDYRNYFEKNNAVYMHVLDPKTGYPVINGVVSVSVIADNCTIADGLATAIMVMGHKKGLELADKIPGIECFIVVREKDGKHVDYSSKGFVNNQKTLFE
ncbi:MAG: FAD:protein FMN transferase [Proteobacteria bacterium]|nr:FAD:protein FMN transferase [Pseudomonadota bacterium]